jgi:16S rRNA (cytosine967-C5)-methyltransferase
VNKATPQKKTELSNEPNELKGANLSQILQHSAIALNALETGMTLTESFVNLPKELRSAVQSFTFTTLRHKARLLHVIYEFINKEPEIEVENLLLVASSVLLPDSPNKYNYHTLVNEAVNAATLSTKTQYAKGLINAVLRRCVENPNLFIGPVRDDVEYFQQWWVKRLKKAHPKEWLKILDTNLSEPGFYLRVNITKITKQEYLELLEKQGIDTIEIPGDYLKLAPEAIRLAHSIQVQQLPGYDLGYFSIQDLGAQFAAHLLPLKTSARVLDACCAPGGKTTHLLETQQIELTSLELDPSRILRVQENLSRLDLSSNVIQGDACDLKSWWNGQAFDAILADVPCSASGIVRRHPDILELRRDEDFQQLSITQKKILGNLWEVLKPGGYLLYVTCSVFPEEGENQSQWLLRTYSDVVRLDCLGQLLPNQWHDGFFYGLFQKKL